MTSGVAQDENDERRGSIGGDWLYSRRDQEAKKEILAEGVPGGEQAEIEAAGEGMRAARAAWAGQRGFASHWRQNSHLIAFDALRP